MKRIPWSFVFTMLIVLVGAWCIYEGQCEHQRVLAHRLMVQRHHEAIERLEKQSADIHRVVVGSKP